MENISLPNKIKYQKGDSDNQGKIIIEPCYPGYGLTLGNALRRVLLSSLNGNAVTAIKIKNVNHEFSTIPHVEEDVVELILNLKKLRLKVHSAEPVILKLKAKGKVAVTAGDIEKNADVEIVDPSVVLANLSNKDAKLEMDIYVSQGRGYVTTEDKDGEDKSVGMISIDSIFTPIHRVSLDVENVRVGQMTNYDKLVIDITTDGTITPEEAMEQSAKILIDHFSLFVGDEYKKTKKK